AWAVTPLIGSMPLARAEMADPTLEPRLQALLKALDNDDVAVRRRAIQEISATALRNPPVWHKVVQGLVGTQTEHERLNYVAALGDRGPLVIDALIDALRRTPA